MHTFLVKITDFDGRVCFREVRAVGTPAAIRQVMDTLDFTRIRTQAAYRMPYRPKHRKD